MEAEFVADGLGAGEDDVVANQLDAGLEEEGGQVAGLEVGAEAVDEPHGDLGGMIAGLAVGQFEQEGLHQGLFEDFGGQGLGEFQFVVPAGRIMDGGEQRALFFGQGGIDEEIDPALPLVGQAQFQQEQRLEALAGYDEDGRFEGCFGAVGALGKGWETSKKAEPPTVRKREGWRVRRGVRGCSSRARNWPEELRAVTMSARAWGQKRPAARQTQNGRRRTFTVWTSGGDLCPRGAAASSAETG